MARITRPGRTTPWIAVLAVVVTAAMAVAAQPPAPPGPASEPTGAAGGEASPVPAPVRVLAWNIWRGGREDGPGVGPRRVVDVIRDSGADLVAMQETYGSGERLAGDLGFHFHPRGTNVSIHSRWPVVEDLSVHEPFQCVGALVRRPDGVRLAVYSIWLPYAADIWLPGTRDPSDVDAMLAACAPSAVELTAIRDAIDERLAGPEYAGVPVIIAGDFNSMSHLDYAEVARDQYGAVVSWPTSRLLTEAGYRDAYREANPVIDRAADRTWSPRFSAQEADRIDFVYVRGGGLEPASARRIDTHPEGFPSDHAAVLAELRFAGAAAAPPRPIRAATYNIRHGVGLDGTLDLDRTAGVLAALEADVIGLQEVDLGVRRSGGVNQAAELGRRLGMHAAFGAFMEYGGGRYGMAVLSRFPVVDVRSIRLPDGHEPRVALLVTVRGPGGERLAVGNVHFDWVDDDGFRFAQASALAGELDRLADPWILLGDFNDRPATRTLDLFAARAAEADKPDAARATFPADAPDREIDFVFAAPPGRWAVEAVRVVPESVASDHRPVVADLRLCPAPAPAPAPAPRGP